MMMLGIFVGFDGGDEGMLVVLVIDWEALGAPPGGGGGGVVFGEVEGLGVDLGLICGSYATRRPGHRGDSGTRTLGPT